jgi:hypothetical protein
MANPLLDVLRARANAIKSKSGVIVPSGNGVNANSLDLALARCATAEANLESARAAARTVARSAGVKISGLFSESQFVMRGTAERWADEARAEGRDEMVALYTRINARPTPQEKAMGDAVRAAIARGAFRDILGKGGAPADAAADLDPDALAEAEEQTRITAEAKAKAEQILAAARLRDAGGPRLPEPTGKAKRILDAAAKAHRRVGDD